jgi:hypothetical protein
MLCVQELRLFGLRVTRPALFFETTCVVGYTHGKNEEGSDVSAGLPRRVAPGCQEAVRPGS